MIIELILPANFERLDLNLKKALLQAGHDVSRTEIVKLYEADKITVAGLNKFKLSLRCEREYSVCLDMEAGLKQPEFEAQNIKLDIVYEDEYLLVVNKPRHMVVHPGAGNSDNTLANALLYYCGRKKLSDINGAFCPGIVHRLDKDTSGLLLVAKNNKIHRLLAQQLAVHNIKRRYHAVVHGVFKDQKITVDAPIGRDKVFRQRMKVQADGKPAVTHFEVLENFQKTSYIKCELETGRTHQIRVHMAYLRHPLVGDLLYAPKSNTYGFKGQALHAAELEFVHPATKADCHFKIDLPQDFEYLLTCLR